MVKRLRTGRQRVLRLKEQVMDGKEVKAFRNSIRLMYLIAVFTQAGHVMLCLSTGLCSLILLLSTRSIRLIHVSSIDFLHPHTGRPAIQTQEKSRLSISL